MDSRIIHDPKRLEALRRYSLTDTHAEAAFDRLTRLASKMLDAPISLVNLITDTEQLCKSAYGISSEDVTVPNSIAFCTHTVSMGEPFVVEDASIHSLVQDNPLVQDDPNLRSYLGIPLQTEDHYDIGTLCVLDTKPRQWSESDIQIMQELTASVMMEIDTQVRMMMKQNDIDTAKLSTMDTPTHIPTNQLDQFGHYNIVEHIDSGGACDVYLCEHEHLRVPVAIKRLRHTHAKDATFRARFELEGNIISSLRHPNIIRVFEVGNEGDNYYMVMEYIHGQTLKTFIREYAPLPLETVIDIGKDIAEALDYAHSQQVVHRDIKPSNIMLRKRKNGATVYQATLMDFGIAKMISLESQLTGDNAVGTVDYIAPEQIEGSAKVGEASDVYAFGTILYEMLTGHLPYEADNIARAIFMHLNDPVPDPRQHVPHLPEHITKALEKALAKCPDDRFRTAIELVAALEGA